MKSKKRDNFIQILVLVFFATFVVMSLVMTELPFTMKSKSNVEVSVIMRENDSNAMYNMRLGMEQAAYDLGGELRFLSPEIANDYTAQQALLSREIESETDAVIITPANPQNLDVFLSDSKNKVPIVALESPLEHAKAYLTPNNYEMGKAVAQMCNENNQPVVLLKTSENNIAQAKRIESCEDYLKQKNIEVYVENVTTNALLNGELASIVQKTGAKTVISFESSATQSIVSTIESLGLDVEVHAIGITSEAIVALERGVLQSVVAWSDYAVGYLAVQAAIEAVKNNKSVNSYDIPFSVVKGDNIYADDIQKLLFPVA